jgi:HAD superfamily hydrolase (TIGR01484 family)
MTKKHLIFLDIDGTLIQPNQKPNSMKLTPLIKHLSKKGVLFGLNSNRSIEDVRPLYKQFHLNGPLVLENGVFFLFKKQKVMLLKKTKAITPLITQIVQDFILFKQLNCKVVCLDTVAFITSKKKTSIPLIIVINKYRQYTSSIHILRFGVHDKVLAKELCDYISTYFKRNRLQLTAESPQSFGNIVITPNKVNKGTALKALQAHLSNYQFHMIGDDPADLETSRWITSFFAVGNAGKEVKEKSDYISKKKYTQGVVDILEYFEKEIMNK